MKTNKVENAIFLMSIIFMLTSCSHMDWNSPDYLKGSTSNVTLYISKKKLLTNKKFMKESYYEKFATLIEKSRGKQLVLPFPISYMQKLPQNINNQDLLLYIIFTDYLPELLKNHQIVVYDNQRKIFDKSYYHKEACGRTTYYLANDSIFYESLDAIIELE